MRDYSYICYYEDELYHHGILGQRWGIRRFQNKDGTLTPRGKKRAEKLQKEYESLTGNKEFASKPKPRSISDMSDEELMNARNRILVENAYLDTKRQYAETKLRDMNAEANYNAAYAEAHKTKGDRLKEKLKASLSKTWTDMVQPALLAAGKDSLTKYMTKTLNEVMGNNKIDPNSIEGLKATFDKLDYQVKIKGKLAELKGDQKSKSDLDKLKEEAEKLDQQVKIKNNLATLNGEQKPMSDIDKLKEEADRLKQQELISLSKVNIQKNQDYFTSREEKLAEKERKQQENQNQQWKEQVQKQSKEATKESVKEDANAGAGKTKVTVTPRPVKTNTQVTNKVTVTPHPVKANAQAANVVRARKVAEEWFNSPSGKELLNTQVTNKVTVTPHPVKANAQAANVVRARKVAEEWFNSPSGKEFLNSWAEKEKGK